MTTFVQAGSAAGILFLPRDVVGPVPVKDGPFRDMEVLSLPGWQDTTITEEDSVHVNDPCLSHVDQEEAGSCCTSKVLVPRFMVVTTNAH
ncbi:MAG: hypothetical protein GEU86_10345, partial [Actinophytocola sp.]|nr:hypothetical protein [Actinophytocola sp.]